jgi:ribosomal protein S6--L-glutamate ligase
MELLLLTRNPKLYSHKRLIEAARLRGHKTHVAYTTRVCMNVVAGRPDVTYRGHPLPRVDAVIPRIGASVTYYGLAVLRQLEIMGIWSVNSSIGIARSRDKLQSLQILAGEGVGLPPTAFARTPKDTDNAIALLGGAPVIVKMNNGTHGNGVVLAETLSSARSFIDAFNGKGINILIQKYIKEATGTDLRCLVVGDKVVAAMERRAASGDFRSNLHRGGSAVAAKISPLEEDVALRSARALGLNVAGVDMLRSNEGPMIMEVNSSPGLEGIEGATGVDVAGSIIAYIEEQCIPRNGEAHAGPNGSYENGRANGEANGAHLVANA